MASMASSSTSATRRTSSSLRSSIFHLSSSSPIVRTRLTPTILASTCHSPGSPCSSSSLFSTLRGNLTTKSSRIHRPSSSWWPTSNPSPLTRIGQSRSMFIQTESTPNEDSLKFLPGQKVMESGTAEFLDNRSAMTSPLAKTLFQIPGVKGVFYGPDFVTVTKDGNYQWSTLKPSIYSSMMEFFTASDHRSLFNDPQSSQGSIDTVILDTDSEVVAMIKELLDTRVRPAIQEDGGDLEYRGFGEETDGIVRIMLKGSCRGCDSSTVTLKVRIGARTEAKRERSDLFFFFFRVGNGKKKKTHRKGIRR
ncbi:HIRA-interacting protein 5 [Violaceomyces palustris]|uniref:HIRA-interacting protein 5 n=1 Tax=Violaceomyces palustris TaxID=1673888 RepID=A0ACD0NLL4_9BASI|nr:HIRA-interacting protein 5 [Violaceomyces palustris]